jgi:hypothetical protein
MEFETGTIMLLPIMTVLYSLFIWNYNTHLKFDQYILLVLSHIELLFFYVVRKLQILL